MRKLLCVLLLSATALQLCACSGGAEQSTDSEASVSSHSDSSAQDSSSYSADTTGDSSGVSEESLVSDISLELSDEEYESSAEVKPPIGVSRESNGKFKFTSSVLSLSVTFPDEFCLINDDYSPQYGIYLQNVPGTATILLEAVEDETLTHRQLAEYLRSQYPDSEVYINDKKEVLCKMTAKDQNGNSVYIMQKFQTRPGGYNKIVLCCKPEEKSKYTSVFKEIKFS